MYLREPMIDARRNQVSSDQSVGTCAAYEKASSQ